MQDASLITVSVLQAIHIFDKITYVTTNSFRPNSYFVIVLLNYSFMSLVTQKMLAKVINIPVAVYYYHN